MSDPRSRGPGRPKSSEPHSKVGTYMPTDLYDSLLRIANRREVSVSKLIADAVKDRFSQDKTEH